MSLLDLAASSADEFPSPSSPSPDLPNSSPLTKPSDSAVGSGLVLLVDDEPGVRGFLTIALEGLGYSVVQAVDGADGLEKYHRHAGEIRLALLDVMMPRLDGWQLARLLYESSPGLPIVLMSAYDARGRGDAPEGCPSAFLSKPFTLSELRTTLATALTDKRDRRPPRASL